MKIKVGFGFDVHALEEGQSLILGGVEIPHTKGTIAHSDGDVLIHAICDALLGAANLRDIGYQFPDTSDDYKDIDSKILLKKTFELLTEKGFQIGNIDSTIAAQKPKLLPHIDKMQKTLADILELTIDDITIKATTTERLGFEGREEGISAYAVVLISKSE
jgi:2-C-methyl-D-erythritol 2,4-cyclodiphosphate synthase